MLLGASVGIGVWCTRASVDLADAAGPAIRVAMLPPVWQLLFLLVVGVVGLSGLGAVLERRARRVGQNPGGGEFGDGLRPLGLTALLALPYLPWLADWFPILLVLAGPGRWLIWLVAIAETLRLTVRRGVIGRASIAGAGHSGGKSWRWPLVIFALSAAVFLTASARLARTALYPGGDEPHYLIITQSLWYDGDLLIENNHTRRDYEEYFGRALAPHYRARGADGEIYSIHPVGLAVLALPAYALGGYEGVVVLLILMAAAGGALLWWWALRLSGSAAAATFAWAAVCLSAPYLFHSFSVYPEIPAGLCVIAVMAQVRPSGPRGPADRVWMWNGLLVAALPWLSTKYAPMAGALMLVLAGRIWRTVPNRRVRLWVGLTAAAPFVLSVLAWFGFFYWIWGTPSPTAPYGAQTQTSPLNLSSGLPGLLFDQEYGIIAAAPVLLLGLTGLVGMWRARGETRVTAAEIVLVEAALISTVGAFDLWWGGSAPPGRPMVSGLLLLGIPIAWQFARAERNVTRALEHLLLLVSLFFAAVLLVARQGLLLANDRDGSARLLEYLFPSWAVSSVAPSFIYHEPWMAGALTTAWLVLAAALVWTLRALERGWSGSLWPGRATIAAAVGILALAAIASFAISAVASPLLQPPVDLARRPRIRLLETYDATLRPLAVKYTPWERLAPTDVLPLFGYGARASSDPSSPGTGDEPVQLLGARFSLPAGEYAAELILLPEADQAPDWWLGLQVGRIGSPLDYWTLAFSRRWRGTFRLPVDVGFIAFKGPASLDHALQEIKLQPLALVDASRRVRTPEVLGSARYGDMIVLSHEERVSFEPTGFWVPGAASSRLTLISGDLDVRLQFHSGGLPNTASFESGGRRWRFDLTPGRTEHLDMSDLQSTIIPLTIRAETAFVPALVDPASRDRRQLGLWIDPR